ncbi:lysoplasmalogenase family protein [Salinibacterium soli]|uniref:Lysoplasmalogenase family protein n=1 Tax=Antiquaquibacter soli TaxID=3064523 RepID=A0ABT9BKY2_9MICO|nr:lysoplasmalogenase family protein [Protaetiibacter sp. WY-16]MDO7881675.1 lysoplasmalogenase family protein [Protaetiibacter sp. WY-16]
MKRSWAFAPFVLVGLAHLYCLVADLYWPALVTKFSLMPALLLALLVALPRLRSEIALWASLAIGFSWAGDILLADPGDLGFLLGLGCFLLAHALYLVLYVRPLHSRRWGWWPLLFLAWWGALLVVLVPHIGALAVPVVIYGLVMCAAAAAATATTPLVAVGATLFLVSDTVLALRFFLPGFSLWEADAVIMAPYIAGQGLIVAGAVLVAQHRVASRAPVA